jgi:hypothetical protein
VTARDDDLRADLRALADEYRRSVSPAPYTSERALIERIEGILDAHEPATEPPVTEAEQSAALADGPRNREAFVSEPKRPRRAATEPEDPRIEDDCGACQKCLVDVPAYPGSGWLTVPMTRMIVCTDCGNKRCPKATDHTLECTGSNEPGQPGSVYGGLR